MSVHPQKYHRRVNDRYTRRTSILLHLMKLVVRPSLRCCHVFVLSWPFHVIFFWQAGPSFLHWCGSYVSCPSRCMVYSMAYHFVKKCKPLLFTGFLNCVSRSSICVVVRLFCCTCLPPPAARFLWSVSLSLNAFVLYSLCLYLLACFCFLLSNIRLLGWFHSNHIYASNF